ncbi:hypothetical protein DPEC_G00316790 [Dallia pectoralis]|uniref:Uncharacterized protein n=1 Tax=Dallia pectoralis TaxID=75939 RepID=A0ACC2FCV2_DALPE|nr:hypothetical protein DPEC_G00316790 [Dallia pectoralis]
MHDGSPKEVLLVVWRRRGVRGVRAPLVTEPLTAAEEVGQILVILHGNAPCQNWGSALFPLSLAYPGGHRPAGTPCPTTAKPSHCTSEG